MKNILILTFVVSMGYACESKAKQAARMEAEKEVVQQQLLDSEKSRLDAYEAKEAAQSTTTHHTVVHHSATSNSPATTTTTTTQQTTTAAPAKKGMSNKTKGALIGAGAGIIAGAAADKKDRVKGAVIGGAIGSAAGFGTGAILDSKAKKKQEE